MITILCANDQPIGAVYAGRNWTREDVLAGYIEASNRYAAHEGASADLLGYANDLWAIGQRLFVGSFATAVVAYRLDHMQVA